MSSLRTALAVVTSLCTSIVLLTASPASGQANGMGPDVPRPDRTNTREAARVDAVPTPRLQWKPCQQKYQCATAELPLDYDHPQGRTVRVALLKVPARDPGRRIGSLFLNPGGPGGSGKSIAERATGFLSAKVLDRFDLVGMDPRGTNDSTRVQCYPNEGAQARDTDVLNRVFPANRSEEKAFGQATRHLATACSTVGRPLSSSMSTTEVARDLDVLRRAVGDRKLTYLGWSYGTYLGQVYANLFPDRVRAVAIDGVLDPVAWQGTRATSDIPVTARLNSAAGSSRALSTLLQRCRRAGAPRCPLMPDPEAAFDGVADALRAKPLTVTDEDGATFTITYADFVHNVLLVLYHPDGIEEVPALVALVADLLAAPQTSAATRSRAASRYGRAVERAVQRRQQDTVDGMLDPASEQLANDYELNASVLCSDSRNPASTRRWAQLAAREDRRSPYFGRHWLWASAVCARSHWTARDEDAYRGPFNRRTASPVLVVGNFYDPATNYDSAVSVSRRLPNSRLLSSDSWGHTAYGTSGCATSAVDDYLLAKRLPAKGTVCEGDIQPYRQTKR